MVAVVAMVHLAQALRFLAKLRASVPLTPQALTSHLGQALFLAKLQALVFYHLAQAHCPHLRQNLRLVWPRHDISVPLSVQPWAQVWPNLLFPFFYY